MAGQMDLFGADGPRARAASERRGAGYMAGVRKRHERGAYTTKPKADPFLEPEAVTGEDLARLGMASATDTAEAEGSGWTEAAFFCLKEYARSHLEFIGEDVKEHAYSSGLERRADAAWGTVMRRGRRDGVTEFLGYAKRSKTAARHGTPSRLWRSLIWERNDG